MLIRALAATAGLTLAGLGVPACTEKREPVAHERAAQVAHERAAQVAHERAAQDPTAPLEPGRAAATGDASAAGDAAGPRAIDAHVHLTTGAAGALVAMLDELGVERAVALASPHLDVAQGPGSLSEYRAANEVVLAAAAAHPGRLIPFVTVELGNVTPEYVQGALDRGACGVKIYQGHRALRERPLAHASHRPVLALLEQQGVPVLLHVNTVRFRADLVELVTAFPRLRVVCAHFCSSRTDLDRLAGIMAELPSLWFDTSHGGPVHGAAGFANLEKERERVIAMMRAAPERFLFGSDLVTGQRLPDWQEDWRVQIQANLDFLRAPGFRFWRATGDGATVTLQDYRGLDLARAGAPLLEAVLRGNAERWLAPCLVRADQTRR